MGFGFRKIWSRKKVSVSVWSQKRKNPNNKNSAHNEVSNLGPTFFETETFFPKQNFPKPKLRLFSETKFFRNRNRDFFSETKFSETETETLKDLAKVSKPRSFETEMSISGGIELSGNTADW